MELKAKDTYRIECSHRFCSSVLLSLIELYQPLMSPQAISFYLTCLAEQQLQHQEMPHQYLCQLTQMNIIELEKARKVCEKYYLITTYVKTDESSDHYLYVLHEPKSKEEFFTHEVYSRLLTKQLGSEMVAQIKLNCLKEHSVTHDYQDISERLKKEEMIRWNEDNEIEYHRMQQATSDLSVPDSSRFDMPALLSSCGTLVFPLEARSRENIQALEEIAVLYGLSVQQMRELIGKSINLSKKTLNLDRVRYLASQQKANIPVVEDEYDLSPIHFLTLKQKGVPVVEKEAKLLEYLALKLKMPPVVINVMIEAILQMNGNQLNEKFVQSVAATWVREGIVTKEAALQRAKKMKSLISKSSGKVQEKQLPQYFTQEVKSEKPVYHENPSKELQEMIRKLKEQEHGKGEF